MQLAEMMQARSDVLDLAALNQGASSKPGTSPASPPSKEGSCMMCDRSAWYLACSTTINGWINWKVKYRMILIIGMTTNYCRWTSQR